MQAWAGFYTATAAASAALLGLLFVVVSINAPAALGPEQAVSRRLTEQAFQNYLAVMMVSLLALFADIRTPVFGGVTLACTATWSIWVFVRFGQTVFHRGERRAWIRAVRRHLSSLIGFAMLLFAATRMALQWGDDYNWLAASTLVLMFSATTVSWELLTRIARREEP
jgi:hypothetical protein